MPTFLRWLIAILCVTACTAQAIPLDSWPTWSVAQPYVSKQVPPGALIVRGSGTNAYYVLEVNPTTGELPVSLSGASISIDFSGPTGSPVPADAGFVGGVDDNGDLRGLSVDTDGVLNVLNIGTDTSPTGDPVPGSANYIAGIDGTGDLTGVKVDAAGELQIDVLSSALPSGAATETTLASIDTKTPALGQATMANSVPVVIASNQSSVPVTSGNLPATVDTNAGANSASTLRVTEGSRVYADSTRYDYTGGSVTTAAWVEVIASTAAAINLVCITDQSGQIMLLGSGAVAAETTIFMIPRGWSGCIPLRIAASTRLSLKAVSATASTGDFVLSGMN